jgi:PAS domain S-box-containing protein
MDALSRVALDSLPHGVLVLHPDGVIAFANREAYAQFGFGGQGLEGQHAALLFPEFSDAMETGRSGLQAEADDAPAASRGAVRRQTTGRRRDGGLFPIELSLRSSQTAEGTFTVAVVTNLSAEQPREDAGTSAVEEQLNDERLVAELSLQFINLPADRVEAAIRDGLRRIGEECDLDRCTFFRFSRDGWLVEPVGWVRPGCQAAPNRLHAAADFPWAFETLLSGRVLAFSTLEEIPSAPDRDNYRAIGARSAVTVPLSVGGEIVGAVGYATARQDRQWHPYTIRRLTAISAAFANVLARQRNDETLQKAFSEAERLRDHLAAENVYLRREVEDRSGRGNIVGHSASIQRVLAQVRQVALTDSTVLLLGETGTGKEVFATEIHELSARRGRPMVRVNCAAIPATLIESELFGREKGAFTGALARQAGRFEIADHSTIFLDEIGDLPSEVQVKLLRVLEERQIERLGNPKAIRVDTRIIAATHRDLEQRVADGSFRADLFYRLNVFPIRVPPLRERVEDIPLLVWRFVNEFSKAFGRRIESIPNENMAALQQYGWPGNIRELRNVVERAMIASKGSKLVIALPTPAAGASKSSVKLLDVEKEHIRRVLESSGWRIRGPGGAADRLGLRPTTLETRMAKLGLTRPKR